MKIIDKSDVHFLYFSCESKVSRGESGDSWGLDNVIFFLNVKSAELGVVIFAFSVSLVISAYARHFG